MAYTMSATGSKADVIGQLRQQAAQQSAGLPNQAERDQVKASVDDAEAALNTYAGDNDSVGVTITGNISQSDPGSFALHKSVGVSISRAATMSGGAPAAQPSAPATTVTEAAAPAPATSQPRTEPRI